MKKIYIIATMALATIFTACEDFNEKNFPGYDEAAKPANLVNYKYELVSSDYATIGNAVKKPIDEKIAKQNDLIKNKEQELKNADNATDSLRIKNELIELKVVVNDSISKLKLDPLYITGEAISKNKYFDDIIPASDFVPYLLSTKYKYADAKSTAIITFNFKAPYDTTAISSANKYALTDDDYIAMGTTSGMPGQYKNFSSSINPDFYIPIWLGTKFPYAKAGDVKLIRYKFYVSSTVTNVVPGIYLHDGTKWKAYNTVNPEHAKFVFKDAKWQYVDSDILIGLNDGLGDFTAVNVIGDQVWAWDSYKYMKVTGYVSGAYLDNEDWLISPAMNLTERVTPWLTFMHVGRYFGDTGTSKDKMRAAITVWASYKSDGASVNPAEWTQLTIPEEGYPSGANWTFITSTPIDLSAFAGKDNVRIAFKYLSSAADGAAGTWEVKDVYVYEE